MGADDIMSGVYIHYGASDYDSEKFKSITNAPFSVKPEGGL